MWEKMAAETICVRIPSSATTPFSTKWKASRRYNSSQYHPPLSSTIRASRTTDDTNKSFKELGMFSLKKKMEDSVLRAEMLAPTALELEEAIRTKQEEIIREYNLWDDIAKSNEILVKLSDSSKVVDALKDLKYKTEDTKLIIELAEMDAISCDLFKQAYTTSVDVSKFLDEYEMSKLLKEPYDLEGACLIIESGSECIYSEIWAEQLVRMYTRWAEKQGYGGRVVEKCLSKSGGIKSAIIEFESKYAYGYLSGERGIHRMIRSSHNDFLLSKASLAAVDVMPLFLESAPDLTIDDKDLMISFPSSCEEQHGRIEPAVYVHHIPTGLKVQSTGERSRFANKIKALNRLKAKLLIILKDQGIFNITNIKSDAIIDTWHLETRRYVFHPNKLVQDVKTGIEMSDLNTVLNGNIGLLLRANINNRQT